MEEVELAISEDENAADLIIFKANNYMEEILLRAQLKIQKEKNQLINNLEKDLEDAIEVAVLEESISNLKEKSAVVITTLRGKIDTEKGELKKNMVKNNLYHALSPLSWDDSIHQI